MYSIIIKPLILSLILLPALQGCVRTPDKAKPDKKAKQVILVSAVTPHLLHSL